MNALEEVEKLLGELKAAVEAREISLCDSCRRRMRCHVWRGRHPEHFIVTKCRRWASVP